MTNDYMLFGDLERDYIKDQAYLRIERDFQEEMEYRESLLNKAEIIVQFNDIEIAPKEINRTFQERD